MYSDKKSDRINQASNGPGGGHIEGNLHVVIDRLQYSDLSLGELLQNARDLSLQQPLLGRILRQAILRAASDELLHREVEKQPGSEGEMYSLYRTLPVNLAKVLHELNNEACKERLRGKNLETLFGVDSFVSFASSLLDSWRLK